MKNYVYVLNLHLAESIDAEEPSEGELHFSNDTWCGASLHMLVVYFCIFEELSIQVLCSFKNLFFIDKDYTYVSHDVLKYVHYGVAKLT